MLARTRAGALGGRTGRTALGALPLGGTRRPLPVGRRAHVLAAAMRRGLLGTLSLPTVGRLLGPLAVLALSGIAARSVRGARAAAARALGGGASTRAGPLTALTLVLTLALALVALVLPLPLPALAAAAGALAALALVLALAAPAAVAARAVG